MDSLEAPVIACNLNAFSNQERLRYELLKRSVDAAVTEIRELPDGFVLLLWDDCDLQSTVDEWISFESRCCPFLTFAFETEEHKVASLRITGPHPAKEVLRDGLGLPHVRADQLLIRR